ncbi:ankyrin and armadillo repeat-containing protein [Trichomycterus rosablanca]|uniref:ankyrin and armadillo repeat-containing protein n=1 Tax=Trichomycterus rosablanca TaxID=2290929 RepID=UPI002F3561A6
MDQQSLNSTPLIRPIQAQRNASAFFEKYDWREVQELLSLTTCSWLFCPEDFNLPINAPPGLISHIQPFYQTSAVILAPFDSSVALDFKVVHQIVRELTVGIYCFNQVPSLSLEPSYDQSSSCYLPPAYYDTKVGQILINVDYTMKALWHGAYIPKEKRLCFSELWRSGMDVDVNGVPQNKKVILAQFLAAGLIDTSDDPCYQGIYEDTNERDPTYEPDSAEEQKLFSQYAENILLKMTFYSTSVHQHENLFTFEGTHSLSSLVRLTEDVLELGMYQRLQQRLTRHVSLVKKNLGRKVELARDLAYLKLIGFLVPLFIGLKKKMRIPDLSQLLPRMSDDKLKTERELPPLLLGPGFSCKHFPYKSNEYFHLHGGVEFDVGTPELEDITEEMKVAFTTLQVQAAEYLNELLRQDGKYKKHFPLPLSEIDGKRYSVISIPLASFYPQANKVQWWDAMNITIKTTREQKLPLTDIQLHEQFKKTFGYDKAMTFKSVSDGLRAAVKHGLSATFYTLSHTNSSAHLEELDASGFSLLHHAAAYNRTHIICQLAAAGINLNQTSSGRFASSGLTPLHVAAKCGSLEALSCLLALHADCRLVDRRGWMAVHFSALYGQVACVQALCRTDPTLLDVNTLAEYHSTPLLLAAMSGSSDSLVFLLSSGADWKTTDSKGNNVVHLATLYFHTNILRRLIQLNLEGLPVWKLLVEMLHSEKNRTVEMAVRCTEALCVNADPYWRDITDAGGVAALVKLLRSDRPLLQRISAAVLCHLTVNAPVCEELVQNEAVRVLVELVSVQNPELQSRCTVILADLAGHSAGYRSHIDELGGVTPVVQLLSSDVQDVLVNAIKCVRALCDACPRIQNAVALSGGIPLLVELLAVTSEVVQEEACLALAELARGHRENQDLICAAGAVSSLVQILSTGKISTQVKAAKAVEAVVNRNAAAQELCQRKNTHVHLMWLLKVFHQETREQGATALWALAGNTPKQQKNIAKLLGHEFILDLVLSTSDKMQYVGCQAVTALSRDSRLHQKGLCREKVVQPLVRILRGSRTTERTLLSVIGALRALCIGLAHTNNMNSQRLIHEEKAVPTLLELLQNHRSLQVKVQVAQTLACILMGNKKVQEAFWEHEDFSYDTIVNLLHAPDRNIGLEAGHALALFAYDNIEEQLTIGQYSGVRMEIYEPFLTSDDQTERARAAFQIIVLAKVIKGSDQVTLTARGVTILAELLQSENPTAVVITAQFLASLAHMRRGLPDAIVTMGGVKHLCAHLYSDNEEVRAACANVLGYLTYNRHAHRQLLVECRNRTLTYKLLMDNLDPDAQICRRFTSEFDRQRRAGLPSLSLEENGGPPVRQHYSKGIRPTSQSRPATGAPLQRSRTTDPRVRYADEASASSYRPKLEKRRSSNVT